MKGHLATEEQALKVKELRDTCSLNRTKGGPLSHSAEQVSPIYPPLPLPFTHIITPQREWMTDECLHRYLRARNWNVKKAVKMLDDTLLWRWEYQPHRITAADLSTQVDRSLWMIIPS